MTEVRVTDWWRPETGPFERDFVARVLDSNYLNEGDVTRDFEWEIARLLGVRHAVATTSGTAALALAAMAHGIGPGDEVIVPDLTFIATANAVRLAGATVVLVDVDAATLTMSAAALERAITSRTRAVIPVHVSGRAGSFFEVLAKARQRGITVIEDAAEAFLSRSGGEYLGTIGEAGCFSFSPNKTLTTGQGGIVVTNDDSVHVRLRELKDQGRPVRGTGGADIHASMGYNFKLTNLQAAVGLAQLRYVPQRLERQRAIYRAYRDRLSGLPTVTVLPFDIEAGETPQWTDVLADRRDELEAWLASHGAYCRRFWFPLHTQRPYLEDDARFPVASSKAPNAIWLPSAFQNTDEQIAHVCDLVRQFYS